MDAAWSYRSLRAAGWSRAAIDAALRIGGLERVRRGVYVLGDACAPLRAATGHGGTLACVSAARHLGLWTLSGDDTVHVWMAGRGRRHHDREVAACVCVEHWDLAPTRDGFALPSVPRILRQILTCRGVEEFFVCLESALALGMIDRAGLAWLHEHTNGEAREALLLARSDADSGLESLLRWRLRGHGVTVRTQVEIPGVGRVDGLIGERLIIELDGRENHATVDLRHKDLVRDANAAIWGFTTLRFDYALVVHDWPLVEQAVLGAIAAGLHLDRTLALR